MADADDHNRRFWLARARREGARFNLGWWLQFFLPWIFAIGLGGAAVLLALRTAALSTTGMLPVVGAAVLLGAIVALFRARPRFITTSDTLTRLDADLRLFNRLTVAQEGVASWPPVRSDARLALRWQWGRLFWPPAAALALALLAAFVPIPMPKASVTTAPSVPPSWTAMEEKLDVLEKTELVEEKAREEFREAVESLRERPQDQWYSHESLEASDHLKAQLNESLASLEKSLSSSLGAMEAARQMEKAQFEVLQPGLDQALQAAAQSLQNGQLPLDPKLLSQLKELGSANNVRELSADAWKKLQERMKEGVATASDGQNNGEGAAAAALAALGQGAGSDGTKPGQGGTSRGPGSAPLTMAQNKTQLGTKKTETVRNDDLSRAVLGDPAGIGQGRHEIDQSLTVPSSGGAMSSTGQGGQATWQQAATPAEQAALQRFFK